MSQPVNFKKITITLVANQRQVISATPKFAQQIELCVPSGSTGPVYMGDNTVDATWIPRASGSVTAFTSSSGGDFIKGPFFDLSKIYLFSATGGDTAIVSYIDREGSV